MDVRLNTTAIVLAAGESRRMAGQNKVFAPLAGRPVLFYSLKLFEDHETVSGVIVVTASSSLSAARRLVVDYGFRKVREVVPGGARRQDSAAAGIRAAATAFANPRYVLFHDAARPFASPQLINKLLSALAAADGAVPAVPVVDTIKEIADDGVITAHLNRENLRAVQTPQAFRWEVIAAAYEALGATNESFTDDAAVAGWYGGKVVAVEGEPGNYKITRPEDLTRAGIGRAPGAF